MSTSTLQANSMVPKPLAIPSKNALRALRRLAFSGPTVFLGAIGSVAGVATVNYNARQKVRLAERIIETKKAIRSVSNGRGASHVRNLCEAAERGEDFTLSASRVKKRNIRSHSSIAVRQEIPEEENQDRLHDQRGGMSRVQPLETDALPSLFRDRRHSGMGSTSKRSLRNLQLAEKASRESHHREAIATGSVVDKIALASITAHKSATHTVYGKSRSASSMDTKHLHQSLAHKMSPEMHKIVTATQQQHKIAEHNIYARPKEAVDHPTVDVPEIVDQWLKPSNTTKDGEVRRSSDASQSEHDNGFADLATSTTAIAEKVPENVQPEPNQSEKSRKTPARHLDDASEVQLSNSSGEIPPEQTDTWMFPNKDDSFNKNSTAKLKIDADPTASQGLSSTHKIETAQVMDSAKHPFLFSESTNFQEWPIFRQQENLADSAVPSQSNPSTIQQEQLSFDQLPISGKELTDPADGGDVPDSNVKFPKHAMILTEVLGTIPIVFPGITMLPTELHQPSNLSEVDRLKVLQSPLVNLTGVHKYAYVATKIAGVFTIGNALGTKLYLETIQRYAENGHEADWTMVELLYLRFSNLTYGQISTPILELIKRLLSQPSTSDRASNILFPDSPPAPRDGLGDKIHEPAFHYLQEMCAYNPTTSDVVAELKKILALARAKSVRPDGQILEPVIAHLCKAGNTDLAESLVVEAASSSHMEIPVSVTVQILCGYATSNKWRAVQRIMDRLHVEFNRPMAMTTMFRSTFEIYIAQKPLDQAYKYLCFAVDYWTIIPTVELSAILITKCIQSQRFDLIRNWNRKIVQGHNKLNNRTDNDIVSLAIGRAWKSMQANCVIVEKTCKAAAFGAVRTPFSTETIEHAKEILASDLTRRIGSITQLLGIALPQVKEEGLVRRKLDQIFQQINVLLSNPSVIGSYRVRVQSEVRNLIRQAEAAVRVHHTLGGRWHVLKAFDEGAKDIVEAKPVIPKTVSSPISPELEKALKGGEHEIVQTLTKLYEEQHSEGLPIDHNRLKVVIERLYESELDKWTAMRILSRLHTHRLISGPFGVPYDLELYSIWLQLAYKTESAREIHKILYAILDTASHHHMTNELLTLTKISIVPLVAGYRLAQGQELIPIRQEFRYLFRRLSRCLQLQEGNIWNGSVFNPPAGTLESNQPVGKTIMWEVPPLIGPNVIRRFEEIVELLRE